MKRAVVEQKLERHQKAHLKHNKLHKLVASILAFIVVAHLFRAIALWNITVEGIIVPVWASWIVVAIGSFLIFLLYRTF